MATRQTKIESVESYPAKSFFVSMLTRDIDLEDAILDLLDNCVDGAIRSRSKAMEKADSLQGFWASIKFNESRFIIEDNCGGIPWPLAQHYAFRMGKPHGAKAKARTIGVVGIGMKRAIFKMGRECHVNSNHSEDSFMVTISPDWFDDDTDWKFKADRAKPKLKEYGTIIEIGELTDGTKKDFKSGSTFRDSLLDVVAETYAYLIQKGFKVSINGKSVARRPVKLCFEEVKNPDKKSELIRPFIYQTSTDGIDVFMAVGYRSRLPTEQEQADEAKATFAAKDAGWTVICNDRVVLSNDRTLKTGWGFGGVPNFHNQFSSIAGIVEFSSPDMSLLPVTTTKRGIDTSNDIYTLIRQKMQEGLKHFTRNTNRWKGFEYELKEKFDEAPVLDLNEIKKTTEKLPMVSIRGNGLAKQYKPKLPEKTINETTRKICFVRELEEIELVSEFLFDEVRTPQEVGETCFDRTLKEISG
jgi:hypothetical protein